MRSLHDALPISSSVMRDQAVKVLAVSVVLKTFPGLAIFLICSLVVGVVLVIQMHLSKVLIYNTRWCWISKKPFLEKKQKLQFLRKKNVILVMDQVLNLELK